MRLTEYWLFLGTPSKAMFSLTAHLTTPSTSLTFESRSLNTPTQATTSTPFLGEGTPPSSLQLTTPASSSGTSDTRYFSRDIDRLILSRRFPTTSLCSQSQWKASSSWLVSPLASSSTTLALMSKAEPAISSSKLQMPNSAQSVLRSNLATYLQRGQSSSLSVLLS